MNTVAGVDREMLKKYVAARKAIKEQADRINQLTHLISLLKNCPDDVIAVCPQVLASTADQINLDISAVLEVLDEFIYIVDAQQTLKDS